METTALGTAFLAAIGIKLINLNDIKKNWKKREIITPKMNEYERKDLYRGWLTAVKKTLS